MPGIAIIDSGVGGLSIYKEIKKQLPDHHYIFVSDNQAFPYGTKQEDQLKQRVFEIVERVLKQFQPDLLVIACNTASTVVLPLLREHFSLPIVGVVPAIKPAAEQSKSKTIGLLATPATIKRPYTDELIDKFAANCQVVRVGSSRLVEIAEEKLLGNKVVLSEVETILQPFFEADHLDIIVLACTHYPLLNNEINELIKVNNYSISLIDSGRGIANRVVQLSQNNTTAPSISAFTKLDGLSEVFLAGLRELGLKQTKLLKVV